MARRSSASVCAGTGAGGAGRSSARSLATSCTGPIASRNSAASSALTVACRLVLPVAMALQMRQVRANGKARTDGGQPPPPAGKLAVSPLDPPMHVLVSNDDGVDAPGIRVLAEALASLGRVTV